MAISCILKRLAWPVICVLVVSACTSSRIDRALKSADALRGAQNFDAALSAYQSIIKKFPGKPKLSKVYLHLGDLYFYNLKENDHAVDTYNVVLQKWPLSSDAALAMQHLAELYGQESRYDRVIEMYSDLLKYFPENPDRYSFMHEIAAMYLKMNNFIQARLELQPLLNDKDVPADIQAQSWYDMGETYFLEGNESQAITYYKKVIELFPKSTLVPMAKLQMAQCYEDLNDLPNAVALEREIRTQYPDNEAVTAKLKFMEKRRHAVDRANKLLPWDRRAKTKEGEQ